MWRPKNFYESVYPLTTLYAVIGHGVFQYPIGTPQLRISVIYCLTIGTISIIALYYVSAFVLTLTYNGRSFFYLCYLTIGVISSTCAAISNWYHYKTTRLIMERITIVDETLMELGEDCQYDNSFRKLVLALLIHLIIMIIMNFAAVVWIADKLRFIEKLCLIIITNHPFHVASYAILYCTIIVRLMSIRLKVTNNILEKITKEQPSVRKRSDNGFFRSKLSSVGPGRHLEMVAVRQMLTNNYHKQLVQVIKISRSINEIHGIQIVVQLGGYFILLTVVAYDFYVTYMMLELSGREVKMGILIIAFAIAFEKIFVINYMSAEASSEANRTGEIINKISLLNDDPELQDEMRQFSLQIMQNPLSFTPAGFFTLDLQLAGSVLGTVAVYLVILIEMKIIPVSVDQQRTI